MRWGGGTFHVVYLGSKNRPFNSPAWELEQKERHKTAATSQAEGGGLEACQDEVTGRMSEEEKAGIFNQQSKGLVPSRGTVRRKKPTLSTQRATK